jgi:hypothetical protein
MHINMHYLYIQIQGVTIQPPAPVAEALEATDIKQNIRNSYFKSFLLSNSTIFLILPPQLVQSG